MKEKNHKVSKLSGGSLSGNLVTVARTVNKNADVLIELCNKVADLEKELEQLKGGKDTNVPTCTDCILDGTDACNRGAGRAVDDEICERFMKGENND